MNLNDTPITAEIFLNEIGRKDIMEMSEPPISKQSISTAVTKNTIPLPWRKLLEHLGAEKGIEVPDHLFKNIQIKETAK